MLMDAVLERFIAHSPMAVAVRGAFEYALSPTPLDDLFVRTVGHAFVNSSNSALLRNASIRPIIAFSFQTAPSGTNIHAGIRS